MTATTDPAPATTTTTTTTATTTSTATTFKMTIHLRKDASARHARFGHTMPYPRTRMLTHTRNAAGNHNGEGD
eukprot:2824525-Alexandrium_andersonii.AAC.1